MAEPVTAAGLLLGVAGVVASGIAGNEAHLGFRAIIARASDQRLDPTTGLPRNHDFRMAARDALRSALNLLLRHVDSSIEAKPFAFRFGELIKSGKPLINTSGDPVKNWIEALRKASGTPSLDALLDVSIDCDEDTLSRCLFGGNVCALIQPELAEAVLRWAETEGQHHTAPKDWEELLREGWQEGKHRITLAEAFCLFFRENLVRRPEAFRDHVTNILAGMKSIAAETVPAITDALAAQLAPIRGSLAEIHEALGVARTSLHLLYGGQAEMESTVVALQLAIAAGDEAAAHEWEQLRRDIDTFAKAFKSLRKDLHGIPLRRPAVPLLPEKKNDLLLLHAKQRAIPLTGREQDMESLWKWLHREDKRVSVRVIKGRAGAGKTRLSYELIWRVAATHGEDWDAGVVELDDLRTFEATHSWSHWEWDKPLLLVIDYAGAVAGSLAKMLRSLAEKAAENPDGPQLRLLLLEREAESDEGWLRNLLGEYSSLSGEAVSGLFDPPDPIRVSLLETPSLRRQVLQDALQAISNYLEDQAPLEIPPVQEDAEFDRLLAEPQWEDPLYLIMAALVAHDSRDLKSAFHLGRTDLATEIAKREARRLSRFADAVSSEEKARLLCHMAAVASIHGGLSSKHLLDVAKEELDALGLTWPGGPGGLAGLLAEATSSQPDRAYPVQPDIVAEAFIFAQWGPQGDIGTRSLVRALLRDPHTVPTKLWQMGQDFSGSERHLDWFHAWMDFIIQTGKESDERLLRLIADVIPPNSVVLADVIVRVMEATVNKAEVDLRSTGKDEERALSKVAAAKNNLAVSLVNAGQHSEALKQVAECVNIRRHLVEVDRETYLPSLAGALLNLANCLSEEGQRVEAVAPAEESVELWREVAGNDRSEHLENLGKAVSTLANRLQELGRCREARDFAEEAESIHRELAAIHPNHRPYWAIALGNFAVIEDQLKNRESALRLSRQALTLWRDLAAENPDAFAPLLAGELSNLAGLLRSRGEVEEAASLMTECLKLSRSLALKNKASQLKGLGSHLRHHALTLLSLGSAREAIAPAEEAIRLFTELSEGNYRAHGVGLARAFAGLTSIYEELEEWKNAMQSCGSALRTLAPFVDELPGVHDAFFLALCRAYRKCAKEANLEFDWVAIGPLAAEVIAGLEASNS